MVKDSDLERALNNGDVISINDNKPFQVDKKFFEKIDINEVSLPISSFNAPIGADYKISMNPWDFILINEISIIINNSVINDNYTKMKVNQIIERSKMEEIEIVYHDLVDIFDNLKINLPEKINNKREIKENFYNLSNEEVLIIIAYIIEDLLENFVKQMKITNNIDSLLSFDNPIKKSDPWSEIFYFYKQKNNILSNHIDVSDSIKDKSLQQNHKHISESDKIIQNWLGKDELIDILEKGNLSRIKLKKIKRNILIPSYLIKGELILNKLFNVFVFLITKLNVDSHLKSLNIELVKELDHNLNSKSWIDLLKNIQSWISNSLQFSDLSNGLNRKGYEKYNFVQNSNLSQWLNDSDKHYILFLIALFSIILLNQKSD